MHVKGVYFLLLGLVVSNLSACSFKKDNNKNSNNNTVVVAGERPKNAFEALERNDLKKLEAFLEKMTAEQINAYSEQGQTLLEIAVRQSNLYIVEKLLKQGALPLKPSQKTTLTPLAIAEKLNASIYTTMLDKVEFTKSIIVDEIKNKNYSQAYISLKYNYFDVNSDLSEQRNFLDILLSQESLLNTSFSNLLPELIDGTRLNLVTYKRLLSVTLTDRVLFEAALKKNSSSLVLDTNFILSLFRIVSDQSLETFLDATLKAGIRISAPLSQLQQELLQKIIASTPQGQLLDLNSIGRKFSLLARHASDNIFCSSCIEVVFDSKALQMQRGEIVKLLVINSGDAPQGFLASLLGRMNTVDFNLVLSSLSKEQRQKQADVLSQNMNSDEYASLKQYGFKLTTEQAKAHLFNLFSRRHKNDSEATHLLVKIGADFSAAKGSISKLEMETLFTNEFNYVRFQKPAVNDLFYILGEAKSTEISGLVTGDGNDIVYYNPKFILKDEEVLSSWMLNNATKLAPSISTSWFLTFKNDEISAHDLMWIQLVNTEKAKKYVIPNFSHPAINKLISLSNMRNIRNVKAWAILDELKSSNSKIMKPDLKYREKYLRGLLASSSSEMRDYLINHLIENTQDSSTLDESFYGDLFVEYLNTVTDAQSMESIFIKSFLPYLLKMNPKYKYLLASSNVDDDMRNYKDFLQGEFGKDILCDDAGRRASYREYCKNLKLKIQEFETCKVGCETPDRNEDQYKILEKIRKRLDNSHKENLRKSEIAKSILARDEEVISSVNSLKKILQTSASISQFLSVIEPLTRVPLKKIETRSSFPHFP